jgi:hypothetical protein
MQRLKELSGALRDWCMVFAILWFVFSMQREVAILNAQLFAIQMRLPDPDKPLMLDVVGLPILQDHTPHKKEAHK